MLPLIASLKSGWARANKDNIGLIAAGIAYYGFLSLVPLLAGAILTYGIVVDPVTIAAHALTLTATLPQAAAQLVTDQLRNVAAQSVDTHGLGLLLALGAALFGARVAAGALITALDMAFDSAEERGFLISNLLAIGITIGAVIALGLGAAITALVATVLKGSVGAFASYLLVALAGFGAALLSYRVLPARPLITWHAAMRGAGLFAGGWMVASAAFGFYASNFTDYDATYGSLGTVVVFLTWLWLSAFLLLLGAHIAAASLPPRE